jgi:hypothetical protein
MSIAQTQLFLGDTQIPFYYLGEQQVSLFPKSIPVATRTGLVFDIDATKLDSYPGSGSTWNSIGGGPNMIAFTSSAFPTWDATNKQFNFNGFSDVLIGNFTSSITNSTMITWAKIGTTNPTGPAEGGGMNYGNRVVGGFQAFAEAISYDEPGVGNVWRMVSSGGGGSVQSSLQTDTAYDLVAAVRENNNFKLYVNGVLQGTNAGALATTFTTGSYVVGSRFINSGNTPAGFFTGSISRVAVYNRVLSELEINDLYEATRFGG